MPNLFQPTYKRGRSKSRGLGVARGWRPRHKKKKSVYGRGRRTFNRKKMVPGPLWGVGPSKKKKKKIPTSKKDWNPKGNKETKNECKKKAKRNKSGDWGVKGGAKERELGKASGQSGVWKKGDTEIFGNKRVTRGVPENQKKSWKKKAVKSPGENSGKIKTTEEWVERRKRESYRLGRRTVGKKKKTSAFWAKTLLKGERTKKNNWGECGTKRRSERGGRSPDKKRGDLVEGG